MPPDAGTTICVYGAGAVGGHLAGRLAEGGATVSLIARGAQLEAIRAAGLRVETRDGVLHSRPHASDDPAALGIQDCVIVTVKAPSLPQVAAGIAPLLGPDTRVVFVMNGIPWWYFHGSEGAGNGRLSLLDPDGAMVEAVAPERVIGAVAYTACTVTAPGVVRAGNPRNRIILGRPDGGDDAPMERLAGIMRAGGLEVEVTPRIRDAVWEKLLANLVGGALGVLTQSAMHDALVDPAVAAAARAIATEGADVAHAFGCAAGDIDALLERQKASTHKQSIVQDLELGRAMEIDALLTAPIALARMADVPTPMLDLIVGLAVQRAKAAGLYPAT